MKEAWEIELLRLPRQTRTLGPDKSSAGVRTARPARSNWKAFHDALPWCLEHLTKNHKYCRTLFPEPMLERPAPLGKMLLLRLCIEFE